MDKEKEQDIEQAVVEQMESWHLPFDQDQPARAKARIMDIIGKEIETKKEDTKIISPQFWMRIAAGVAVIIVISIAISILGKVEVNNDLNEQMAYTLPDGSQVTLNPDASLTFNTVLWSVNRSLEFTGEGYFDVSKGNTFRVQTPIGDIAVLGTRFSVWADEDDLMVHCNEGSVEVSNEVNSILLSEHQFTHHQSKGLAPKKDMKHEGFLAPRKNSENLTFNEVPLAAVIQELELVLNTEIKCSLDVNSLSYSGTINPSDLTTCFNVLCKPFGAKHKRNPDGVFVIYE